LTPVTAFFSLQSTEAGRDSVPKMKVLVLLVCLRVLLYPRSYLYS
jgi:hypothetical protein